MSVYRKLKKVLCVAVLGIFLFCFGQSQAYALENERYKTILYGGGALIIDTQEGHLWTWSGPGGEVNKDGASDQIIYQGNVRKNMNPAKIETRPATNKATR